MRTNGDNDDDDDDQKESETVGMDLVNYRSVKSTIRLQVAWIEFRGTALYVELSKSNGTCNLLLSVLTKTQACKRTNEIDKGIG